MKDDQPLALLSEDVSTGQGDLAPQQRVLTKQRIAELDGQIESHELSERQEAARLTAQGQSLREGAGHLQHAFPSERFGVVDTVSRAPIMPAQVGIPLDIKEPVYRITATLATDHVNAYGRPRALMPGMTFKASVVTAKRTFLQWMLDPLFAAGRDIN